MNAIAFDRVADIYDATRALPEEVMDAVMTSMRTALDGCPQIIDAGVGTGRFAKPLQDLGFEVVGIDIARKMLAKAKEKGLENLVVADAHHIPFRDGAFDAAVVIHVMHIVEDWRVVASEIGRVCRKKVISVLESAMGGTMRMSSEYTKLRAESGHPLERLEGAEKAIMVAKPPLEMVQVTEYSEEENTDEEIAYLEKHGSSRTWGLDEETHREIIERLRALYSHQVRPRRQTVSFAIWEPQQFRGQAGA